MSRKKLPLKKSVPLNFLIGCSDRSLADFELARLAKVGELRKELHLTLDNLIEAMTAAALAGWFRKTNREVLREALNNPEDVIALAREQIALEQREDEELIPLTSLPPGAAHLAAAMRYAERNLSEGKCAVCPEPLAHNSVRYCEKHLTKARLSHKPKGAKGAQPGTIGWLHGDMFQSGHGRQPGTLASLAMSREKKTRALLADLGMLPDSAAVSLKASIEALLKCMPHAKADALTQAELFEKVSIPSKTTGGKALQQLLSAGQIQRIGDGCKGNPYRYFGTGVNRETLTAFGVSTKTLVG